MTWRGKSWYLAAACLMALAGSALGQTTAAAAVAGRSWQLVRFRGGDDTIVTPDDRSKYTFAFGGDGLLAARIDCNRGRGTWKSAAPGQIEFGPLALTRAMCPPQSMHDRIVKHLPNIRSFVVKDGHLFLSLIADGGIYELEPMTDAAASSYKPPVPFRGPVTFTCVNQETLRATFYKTQPAMVLVEIGGVARPAFQVSAASGSRYEGDRVLFWEARGEATVNWMGVESTCKPN